LNETILTIAVILILIAGPFWLIKKIEEKDPIFKDRRYVQIRGVLRETLLPIGFVENEVLGSYMVNYKRDNHLVELFFDYRDKEYAFFASHDVEDPTSPPRQVAITFNMTEYVSEKKKEIRDALNEWIETIE
jgi:hypothetical protein